MACSNDGLRGYLAQFSALRGCLVDFRLFKGFGLFLIVYVRFYGYLWPVLWYDL